MSLNAAALRLLAEKGLTASDIAELAEVLEVRRDPTAADRMRRYRAKKSGQDTVTVTRNVTPVTQSPPNDIYSNPPEPLPANAGSPPFAEQVVSVWNEAASKSGMTPARSLDASRKAALRSRAKAHGEQSVFDAIANLAGSKFHCGDNDRGWKATMGWFLKSENFLKALEMGNANGVKPPGCNGTSNFLEHLQAKYARAA